MTVFADSCEGSIKSESAVVQQGAVESPAGPSGQLEMTPAE